MRGAQADELKRSRVGVRNAWERGASGPTAICPSRIPPTPWRATSSLGATGHGNLSFISPYIYIGIQDQPRAACIYPGCEMDEISVHGERKPRPLRGRPAIATIGTVSWMIEKTGHFNGLLPISTYSYYNSLFDVSPMPA
ncbi:hypothetical protein KQX54_006321 [Cotesia glomerata]|uniref:Uncharacterized protein n=1 Tax=Cotesia glomerata TaxID=32391 RepID=A0AAV7I2R5_COTGL|nr:hypothetical protein KQX54_006321 [Cotesia glomerata]